MVTSKRKASLGATNTSKSSSYKGNEPPNYLTRDEKVRKRLETFAQANGRLPAQQYQHELSKILATVELTDAGNSLRFFARYGHSFHFIKENGSWLQWNGRIWKKDETFSILGYASKVASYIEMEADCIPLPTDDQGNPLMYPQLSLLDKPTPEQQAILKSFEEYEKQVETLRKWARGSRSRRSLEAMIELLKAEPGVTLLKSQLDADDMLINCQNGILDLNTMQVRAHDKNALCTRIASVNAVPGNIDHPKWDEFMNKVMLQRPELIRYIQQLVGMGLTGRRFNAVFPVFHGKGSNGKTVFQEVWREILGTYADVATSGMFLERKNDNDLFEVASLDGIRFLFKDETKQGSLLDEGTVKAMTGGGALRACFKFRDHFTFLPKFTSILSTNHKPRITGNDDGIWRRVKLIPWEYSFEKDPGKMEIDDVFTMLRKEHESIFSWACQGLKSLLENGYFEPDEVKIATKEYRNTSDIMGAFIDEKCVVGKSKDCWVTLQGLYDVYRKYMEEESGNKAFSKPNFSELMSERGFEKSKSNSRGGWHWVGIRLREANEPYQEPETPLHTASCGLCGTTNWRINADGKNECATCYEKAHSNGHAQEPASDATIPIEEVEELSW